MAYIFASTSVSQAYIWGVVSGAAVILPLVTAIIGGFRGFWHRRIRKLRSETRWYQDKTLKQITNSRYGFTINRPLSWIRPSDPTNNDGVTYIDPKNNAVSLIAYGRHSGVVPGTDDITWQRDHLLNKLHAKITHDQADGGQIQIASKDKNSKPILLTRKGWRFQYTFKNKKKHKITVIEKFVFPDNKTFVCISLQAPTKLWPAYEDVFNLLANDLVVLEEGYDRK